MTSSSPRRSYKDSGWKITVSKLLDQGRLRFTKNPQHQKALEKFLESETQEIPDRAPLTAVKDGITFDCLDKYTVFRRIPIGYQTSGGNKTAIYMEGDNAVQMLPVTANKYNGHKPIHHTKCFCLYRRMEGNWKCMDAICLHETKISGTYVDKFYMTSVSVQTDWTIPCQEAPRSEQEAPSSSSLPQTEKIVPS